MPDEALLAIRGGSRSIPEDCHGTWPQVQDADLRAIRNVLERGWLSGSRLPPIVGLEKEWAYRCGVRHCVATNSGTAALHAALVAAGVKAGDEVIVPSLSFVATAFAVAHQGAIPVFADIEPDTFTIDPDRIERLVSPRTAAVLAVHLHGMPADMDRLATVAHRHGLELLEDAAQAHGATYGERPVGSLGDGAGFSLNATKGLVGGEGGLYVTDDDDSARAARRLVSFGEDVRARVGASGVRYWSHALGWNYRCSPLSAALARSQLGRLDERLERTREAVAILAAGLSEIPGVVVPDSPPRRMSSWNKYRVRLNCRELGWTGPAEEFRDRILAALQAEGVAAALWQTVPLPAHPAFRRGAGLRPWAPGDGEPTGEFDEAAFPVTVEVLADSLLLGSERMPICAQNPRLMHRYVEAFAKVVSGLDQLAD